MANRPARRPAVQSVADEFDIEEETREAEVEEVAPVALPLVMDTLNQLRGELEAFPDSGIKARAIGYLGLCQHNTKKMIARENS